ncbi:HAD family hydrolase [Caballeronia insecticola]|uniref:HAD-superfamily hydrolase subfamily IA variant 2 n=1 Tax=Caballeronia insecticola TaxID=758793 RepID=R4X4Q8_9BURK|nr:HAD-IA family hydrolase [Caballeronia insecticola]BAN27517.1 HAD-superfamily hydrolase subfamily IA variant 2 [Caballeronia insecticola]
MNDTTSHYPKAVLFDLLTALLDSWTLWNESAGSPEHGRIWRAEYLKLTYECGAYVDYETLVQRAARNVGLPERAAASLRQNWQTLQPWHGAQEALERLQPHCKLAVVTNCSIALGREAASILPIRWDAIVTAEEAGFYKPNARPYLLALDKLGIAAHDAAFVAGSSYDMLGTAPLGLRTYWHNHISLAPVPGSTAPDIESPTLEALPDWASRFNTTS